MTITYLGIDVSKEKLDIAFRTDHATDKHYQCTNDLAGFRDILRWTEVPQPGSVHVCLEATGQYSVPVAEFLHLQGYMVSLVNPVCIKNFARCQLRRNKTDKLDAVLIADFCKARQPAPWTPLSPQNKALKALSRRLEDIKDLRLQEKNRLYSGTTNEAVLQSIHSVISFFDEQIKELEGEIRQFIQKDPELKRKMELLLTIPCVGEKTATILLAELPDVTVFKSARQLAAFVGLTPEIHDSGSSIHKKPRMSKKGNAVLRKALYMPAVVGKKWNPIIHAFCDRLLNAGKNTMVVIGAAMRKLIHIVYGILKSGQPFDPNFLNRVQFVP